MKTFFISIPFFFLISCTSHDNKHLFENKSNKFVYVTNYKGKKHEVTFEFFYDPKQSNVWHRDVYRLETPYYHQYWYKDDNSIFISFMNSRQASKIFDFRSVVGRQTSLCDSNISCINHQLVNVYYSKGLLDSVFCYEITRMSKISPQIVGHGGVKSIKISKKHGIIGYTYSNINDLLEYHSKQLD